MLTWAQIGIGILHSGIAHERQPNFRHRKKEKKQKRGHFKAPTAGGVKIVKCLICFPNPKFIQLSLHFLHQGIWKPILGWCQTFVIGKLSPGIGYWVPPLAFVLPCAVNQYAWNIWINLWIKMWIWLWLVNIVVIYGSYTPTSYPGSLLYAPTSLEERPWFRLVTCLPDFGR